MGIVMNSILITMTNKLRNGKIATKVFVMWHPFNYRRIKLYARILKEKGRSMDSHAYDAWHKMYILFKTKL
mgnify:CR=1 FL=1